MNKKEIICVVLAAIAVFLIVYSPHLNYRFPYHIDEWSSITEALKLRNKEYSGGLGGFKLGFHVLLADLSFFLDLVTVYRFLPALWAVISALTLFFVVFKKTGKYYIALLSMVFFASIKSNTNITGLWFFTALTFSIPFIFLYVWLFTEGIQKKNKKWIVYSLAIMAFLLPIHAISVTFALPFLAIYSLFHYRYLIKEKKFFSIFLALPILGALLFSIFSDPGSSLIKKMQFKYGWGIVEVANSFSELYSVIGYALAVIGALFLLRKREAAKKYLIYILWPITTLVHILIFRLTGTSYLAPYQRYLYYFAISLPMLSAYGLYHIAQAIYSKIKHLNSNKQINSVIRIASVAVVLVFSFYFTFKAYNDIPERLVLYEVIDEDDYEALLFLSGLAKGKVIADPEVSVAIYPVAQQEPVGTLVFYGKRGSAERFFSADVCWKRKEIIDVSQTKYVLSRDYIDCGWNLIYDKKVKIYSV